MDNPLPTRNRQERLTPLGAHKIRQFNDNLRHPLQAITGAVYPVCALRLAPGESLILYPLRSRK